nr:MAG TPA: desulfoferrodoxin [Caudoviricetes sp.]
MKKITGRCWHVYSKMPEHVVLYKCLKCEKVISK